MLDGLYENIGDKIKGWAKWIFIIEAITAIIGGISLIVDEEFLYGLLCLLAGPIVALVSTWLLYAFGELVEKTIANENHTRNILKIMQDNKMPQASNVLKTQTNKPKATHSWRCDNCGKMATQSPCEYCGK